jgi:hypothetical protein
MPFVIPNACRRTVNKEVVADSCRLPAGCSDVSVPEEICVCPHRNMWIWLAYSLCPSKSHPETVIVFVSKFWNDACILQLPNERILQNSILSSVEQNCKVQNHFMRSSKFDFIGPTKQRRSTQNWILREHSMFIFSFHHACWHSSIFYFLPSAKWKFKFINDWKCWISCN